MRSSFRLSISVATLNSCFPMALVIYSAAANIEVGLLGLLRDPIVLLPIMLGV